MPLFINSSPWKLPASAGRGNGARHHADTFCLDLGQNLSYNKLMKLTLQLQLLPDTAQRQSLLNTMEQFNAAASHAARVGFDAKRFSQPSIHPLCYRELRERFGLSSQMAVRAIGKAVECFQRDKTRCPKFRDYGAMTYDQRLMSFKGMDRVSLLTLDGRQIIPIIYGQYQSERFDRIKGQCDLVYRAGKFYLLASIDLPDKAPIEVKAFVGVDLGVINLATTSDGQRFGGEGVEVVRQKHLYTRRSLGRKMGLQHNRRTRKNARRAMKRIGDKEMRFRRHVNHCISKQLVTLAKDTGRGIAVEELTGIRDRTRFRKKQRAKMGGWAFAQLRQFITYKGQLYGVPVVVVDPRNSSRTCAVCYHCEKSNRTTQDQFQCRQCGHAAHADHNAAINLAARAASKPAIKVSQRQPPKAA